MTNPPAPVTWPLVANDSPSHLHGGNVGFDKKLWQALTQENELGGEGSGSIGDHILQIHTDRYVPADENLVLSGRIESVSGTAVDFTHGRGLKDVIGEPLELHGDNYMIRRSDDGAIVLAAKVTDPGSGRSMEVLSDASSLQLYTGKFLGKDGLHGKSGNRYNAYDALCLECHGYPDGVNVPEIEDIILRPGMTYRQTTMYRFSP